LIKIVTHFRIPPLSFLVANLTPLSVAISHLKRGRLSPSILN